MSTHVYQPLEGPEHIRLIALHPASSKDARLEITFLASTLEDLEGRYEAISYTWGQPLLKFALHVDDGTQVCVTENLDRALRYLRYNDRDRLLWADAACINQNGNAEKAVQIPLMVDIFRGAQRVMAWLDPGGDTAVEQRGMRIIERLSRISKHPHTTWAEEGYSEVMRFISLPWFTRLWIVQEVVFGLEISLICGDTQLSFPRLIAALPIIKNAAFSIQRIAALPGIQDGGFPLDSDDSIRVDAIAAIGRLWNIHSLFGTESVALWPWSSRPDTEGKGILSLVETFALYACTDPRDRVFALFSMAANSKLNTTIYDYMSSDSSMSQEEDAVSMNIDYSLNVLETYKAFAISCWKEKLTHTAMWHALLVRQHSSRPDDWPSWVPDWRAAPEVTPFKSENAFYGYCHVVRATSNGLRVKTRKDRLVSSRDNVQPYTVRSRVVRESIGSEVSLESQVLQLLTTINGPVNTQDTDRSTDRNQPRPGVLDTTQFPSLLHKAIEGYAPSAGLDSDSDDSHHEDPQNGNILQKLIEDLTSRIPEYPTEYQREDLKSSFRKRHDATSEDIANLFVFHDPGTQVNSIGYGDVAPEIGDHIVPVGDTLRGFPASEPMSVLIFRQSHLTEKSPDNIPTYRFVGTGRIYDPTRVLMNDALNTRGEELETYLGTREKVVSSLGCKIVDYQFDLV